jgi:adenine-specific DNA-methyltransferase
MNEGERRGRYEGLSRAELIQLLERRDRERKFGLVWERNEIEADRGIEGEFVAATPVPNLNERAAPWRNLVIEGENYDALRWLRMTWTGRVKCIYVDPPYNTGNKDWVYNDRYFDKDDRWRHSTWLEFLYRRFALARDLLTEDGVILVSINDENRAKLELLLDDVLPGMRKGSFVWRTRVGGNEGGEAYLSDNHEHILAYGNAEFRFGGTNKTFELYSNPNNDPRGDWKPGGDLTVSVSYTDKRAGFGYYPLFDPERKVWYPCNPDAVWRYASREISGANARIKTKFMEDWIAAKQIAFPDEPRVVQFDTIEDLRTAIREGNVPKNKAGNPLLREGLPDLEKWVGRPIAFGTPSFKRFKNDVKRLTQPLSSWITPRSEIETRGEAPTLLSGLNNEGAASIKSVFGQKAFNYAKPPSLIRELLQQAASPEDVILDFFAGSATTAQAVMSLNAEDGGDRRFIMVSSTEANVDNPDKNLCRDVTAERIRRLNASDIPEYAAMAAEFADRRCRTVRFEDLDYDLKPEEVWAALEALHQLPLTPYVPDPWIFHQSADLALVYVDRFRDDLLPWLQERAAGRAPTFVYAWAPAQIRDRLASSGDVEVRGVRETLVARFKQ